MLCVLHLKINSSVSTWLQRQNAPYSLHIFYTLTDTTQTNSWMEGQDPYPVDYWLSSPPPPPVCPLLLLRMEMKHFLCFSQHSSINVAAPSANNSGQERALYTSCAEVSTLHPQPASQGDSEEAAFDGPERCLRSSRKRAAVHFLPLLPLQNIAAKVEINGHEGMKGKCFSSWQEMAIIIIISTLVIIS